LTRGRVAALVVALAIAAGLFEPFYFRIFTIDRARFGAGARELPYRRLAGLRRFLLDVRAQTRRGDIIAVYGPLTHRDEGFDYLYGRAVYHLAGRQPLPMLNENDALLTGNIRRADYIAAWHAEPPVRGFVTVWRSSDGVLMRRVR
jgi:hypothetical protein